MFLNEGGVDEGEDPISAAIKELREETGFSSAEVIAEVPYWLTYDFPPDVREKLKHQWGSDWKGQAQKWFLLKFTGKDEKINLLGNGTEKAEFGEWSWMSPEQIVELAVDFKKPVYKEVMTVFAPHLQGGGSGDSLWHKSGSGLYKQNSVYDFVACADYLVNEDYVHRDRVGAIGFSARCLVVGAAINMYPDLFRAAILKVPFLDVCNTLFDPSLPLTILDYEEFGNPQIHSQFKPRVLGVPQIKSLRDRLDNWLDKVHTALLSVEAEAPDLVAS
ncbi:hypothetical protein SO802_024145 [Lithocarpus litseifolius]|uniref:Prolyl endopeptidase n=1 Tax=Lithocarpus litseifolius TaxID=425828 RepID=A0AAW2CAT5_9ROSI